MHTAALQAPQVKAARPADHRPMVHCVEVLRAGRVEPLFHTHPVLSSAPAHWAGLALENYSLPACVIPRHQHVENFLHVVTQGDVQYEVFTAGHRRRFTAGPGTTFILPRGTVDELLWKGETQRIAMAFHPSLLVNALEEGAHQNDIELTEHWNLTDPQIMAVLLAMRSDLHAGCPAGPMFGESLANSLAVYLLNRYTVRRYVAAVYRGGLPQHSLRRVLEYIDANLSGELRLAQLAALTGMSPHYFATMFRRSTGNAPHQYVLMRRIARARQFLADPGRTVVEAALEAGFPNPSHFARAFRKVVGTTPSRFQQDVRSTRSR